MIPLNSKTVDVGMSEISLLDALYSSSGVVGVKPDPVEEEKIKRILDAAIRAPSGNNAQPWQFVVVRDPEVKARIKRYVVEGMGVYFSKGVSALAEASEEN